MRLLRNIVECMNGWMDEWILTIRAPTPCMAVLYTTPRERGTLFIKMMMETRPLKLCNVAAGFQLTSIKWPETAQKDVRLLEDITSLMLLCLVPFSRSYKTTPLGSASPSSYRNTGLRVLSGLAAAVGLSDLQEPQAGPPRRLALTRAWRAYWVIWFFKPFH